MINPPIAMKAPPGQPVVLRDEGAHRGGCVVRHCALGVHDSGLGGGQAHAGRSAAWRGAQGVGRRRISGAKRDRPPRRATRPGYDQPQDPIQGLCGPVTAGEEPVKARVRAKVEHPFRILKRVFGFEKTRYRGLRKNHQRLCVNFAPVNLYLHRRRLAPLRP
jgi:hypothetical protein